MKQFRHLMIPILVSILWQAPALAVSLEECIHAALENNPSLSAAEHRIDAARAAGRQARSAYAPSLFVSGQITRTDNPTQAFMTRMNQRSLDFSDPTLNFNDPDDAENLRLSTGIRHMVYDGGQRAAHRRMSHYGVGAGTHAAEAVRNTLIFTVMESYYRALQANAFVAVHEEALRGMEENLRVARQRHEAGAAPVTDVLNLDVQVARTREEWLRAKHAFESAINVLNTAIGFDLVTADVILPPQDASPDRFPELPSGDDMQRAIDAHPTWQATMAATAIRRVGVDRARRAAAPSVHLFCTLDWDSDVSSDFERSYLIGLTTEWQFFDGGRRRADVAEARALFSEATAQLEEVRQQLELDWKQAELRMRDAHERLAVTRAIEKSAEAAWSVTRAQYQEGAATLADLLTAQSGRTATQAGRAAAHYDFLIALADWERAKGNLISMHDERITP